MEGKEMATEWKPDVCIYHGGCTDGTAAAWAVWKRWGDAVQYVPMFYGDKLADKADVAGKHMLMVDFSLKRGAMIEAAKAAASIVVLDHHKTAEEDLGPPFARIEPPIAKTVNNYLHAARYNMARYPEMRVVAVFDMEKSGCRLAWEFCHPYKPIPRLLEHIEDRDLWRYDLPHTKEISAALRSHELTFGLLSYFSTAYGQAELEQDGVAILRAHDKTVSEIVSHAYLAEVGGHANVPVVNVPYQYASDVGHALLKAYPEAPFAGTWARSGHGKVLWSLRSEDGRVDVAEVAARHGGGGHRNASGFSMPLVEGMP